ncbi:MAG: extensin family protein [Myxococcales bacterium]|nr:extensin family protein [Myxococcales bacterium]
MAPRLIAVLAALLALGILVDDAEARRPKPKHKRAHATRRAPRRPANMPDGWTWPPSKTMRAAGKACTTELSRLGVAWKPATAARKIATPITVPAMVFGGVKLVPTFRRPPFVMDCQLARALTMHGRELHARGVRELHFSRIYGYTPVRTRGKVLKALSRHALGLAVDVRAIVDDTGHKAVVQDDYLKDDPLLLAVEAYLNDSGGFRTVLTPRNDPASHYDHFHVEARADFSAPPTPKRPRS